jgi:DNA-binding CsgD family transcriptional regulator
MHHTNESLIGMQSGGAYLLDPNLKILRTIGAADSLIHYFFARQTDNDPIRLPFSLHCWLIDVLQEQTSTVFPPNIIAMRAYQRHGRILMILLLREPQSPGFQLQIQEDPFALRLYHEVKRKLTRRQMEMYHHIKDGERNIQKLAEKMGISIRTAEGHKMNLQRILPQI